MLKIDPLTLIVTLAETKGEIEVNVIPTSFVDNETVPTPDPDRDVPIN
jgi:hypothetical protein